MPTVDGLTFSYVLRPRPTSFRFRLGSRVGHDMFGLGPAVVEGIQPAFRPGAAIRVHHGAVTFSLVPRNLDRPELLTSLAS